MLRILNDEKTNEEKEKKVFQKFHLSIKIKSQVEKLLSEREKSIIRARKMAETSEKLRELIKTVIQ